MKGLFRQENNDVSDLDFFLDNLGLQLAINLAKNNEFRFC